MCLIAPIMSNIHEITLAQAVAMTHAYSSSTQFQGLTRSVYFDQSVFVDLLSQPDCVGIRSYFSLDEQGNLTLVLVGSDINGDDITSGFIMDKAQRCPPNNCSLNSPLM